MRKHFGWIAVLIAILLVGGFPSTTTAVDKNRILFIAAYHPAFPTFTEQVQGLRATFDDAPIELDIEFMDTKRFDTEANVQQFYERLTYKLSQQPPYEALIVADDSALEFALAHQNDLFANIPIIFLGVNNVDLALAQNDNPQVTGVVEAVSMADTITLMQQLQPNLQTVYALVDGTNSGQGDLITFYDTAASFPQLTFDELSLTDLTFAELGTRLSQLPPDSSVLLLSAYHDRANTTLDFDDSLDIILSNTAVPVYHLWYHGLGDGLVGGRLISHKTQAQTAAHMALDILTNPGAPLPPVMADSPNVYVVDYSVAQQWRLALDNVPPDTILLNVPENFFTRYRSYILTATAVFAILIGLMATLIYALLQQRRAEQKLRHSEQKYRTYVDSAPYGVVVTDANGVVQESNRMAVAISGFPQQEIVGEDLTQLPQLNTAVRQSVTFLEQLLQNGHGETDWQIITADNQQVDLQVRAVRLDEDQLLIYFSDETKRIAAERSLQESNAQLQQALDQLQQTQAQLVQQERLAAVGQLAAGIAHDFNNILASIILYAELAQKTDRAERNEKFLQTVISQSHRAADLVQQILDFGRQAMLSPEAIELTPVIDDLSRLLRRTLPEHIEISFSHDEAKHTIYADLTRVQQAILNLAFNARNAMPNGGKLTIQLLRTPPNTRLNCVDCESPPVGTWVGVQITDTGYGIPDDVLPRIFEPFFTTNTPSGSGLGLAQVFGIMKQHEGHITVDTAVGKGTTFTLYWPAWQSVTPPPPDAPTYETAIHGQGQTILVAEDNTVVRQAIVETLTALGYETLVATDGPQALKTLRTHHGPDNGRVALILADWIMPGLNGEHLIAELRQIDASIPLLVLSGHALQPQDEEARLANKHITAWLQKPVDSTALSTAVARALHTPVDRS